MKISVETGLSRQAPDSPLPLPVPGMLSSPHDEKGRIRTRVCFQKPLLTVI